ncbi:MAG: FAD-dependent oxidoreductase [Bryobacterales bacterium]|nr:FAD-dependent oxidoreductase [Bryobacterales bacterium]
MHWRRREFLALGGLAANVLRASELSADVAVIGGGVGGCAAALALARNGLRVVLTEETDWIGGQLSQQAVPPDEHPWIESFGAPSSYRVFRQAVRRYYQQNYPLLAGPLRDERLNPGACSVSKLCHEPRAAVATLEAMMAPHVSSGRLTILREHEPVAASVDGDRIASVRVRDTRSGAEREVQAKYVLDATETGELLALAKVEYVTGAEAQSQTGELHAKPEAQPANMQAVTWCFVMEHVDGEDFRTGAPPNYAYWRDYAPDLTPAWTGKLLHWDNTHPVTLEPRTHTFDPRAAGREGGLWVYRRLIHERLYEPGAYAGGMCVVNWPQNDYWLGNVIEVSTEERERHLRGAKELSLALFHWLQTEAPRPDGKQGWPGLRLRPDVTGTEDGLAKRVYIRESRRIRAEFTVTEGHVGAAQRKQETGAADGDLRAASFPDSVGVGSYRIDLHPSTGGDNYIDVSSLPFEIPLGALIPERLENLLPACKNLGVTHITNGCYRLHPVEWGIGEAAGLAAAYALRWGKTPRQIRNTPQLLADFQREIERQGVETRWPDPMRAPR